ncbi:MAG: hypothetical protein ACI8X5_002921 [Planctomycetota bacterium]|jgi:hypothetical protein
MAWKAWYRDAPDWPEWRPQVQADAHFSSFFTDNLIRVMVRSYDQSAISSAGQKAGLFERSRRELHYLQASSGPKLVELLMVGDSVVSFLAGDVLMRIDNAEWTLPVAQKLLNPEPEDRRRAAALLGKLPFAGPDEDRVWELLEEVADGDEEWFMRAQAQNTVGLRSLMTGRLDRARPILSKGLNDQDDSVVQATCQALRINRDVRTIPALINLLERVNRAGGDPVLLLAGQSCLRSLTGVEQDLPPDRWRDWWRENRP